MADDVKHDFHVVEPSPWPVVGALGALVMLTGAVFWLNNGYAGFGVLAGIPWIFAIGAALVLFTAIGWWRDVVIESVVRREHRPIVKLGLRFAVVLFLFADLVFFAALFATYGHFALFPGNAGLAAWPPAEHADRSLLFLATVILVTALTTVRWAHHAQQRDHRRAALVALLLTVALGAGFAAVMAHLLTHLPFPISFHHAVLYPFHDPARQALAAGQGNGAIVYGSLFVLIAGLITAHIAAGTIFLAVCLGRVFAGHFTAKRHFGFEAASWYWHSVIAIWLVFYACLIVIG